MGKKKEITAYQINNVLRVYGEQLRRGMISNRKRSTDTNSSDKISISAKARRESIADDITSNIIERITQSELNDNVENGAFLRQCLNSKINYTTSCHLIEIKN